MRDAVFPFTAIVGQEPMKLALLVAAVNPHVGGVLIRGQRGTAKSTAARALAALLPEIDVVEGCPCGCDPAGADRCDACAERLARDGRLPAVRRRAPFVDLPVSATEDRVVGSFDLEAALRSGQRRFEPGLLAAANRGVLYVDEVNLLDDHLVDLLLDVAASGVNIVEREGVARRHPSRFVLVGTMNPEEGELRPQLLDRFGLCVDVSGTAAVEERVSILQRCLAFDRSPTEVVEQWAREERSLSNRLSDARTRVPDIDVQPGDLRAVAHLVGALGLEGHRAEIVILRAACASAALDGRRTITDADVLRVAPLALAHRLGGGPLDEVPAASRLADLGIRLEAARAASGGEAADAAAKKKRLEPTGR